MPPNPVIHGTEGRKYQDRRAIALLAQDLDDGQAVEMGQHAIGDDAIVLLLRGLEQAVATVRRVIDTVARFRQRLDQVPGGIPVVLDQQQSHLVKVP